MKVWDVRNARCIQTMTDAKTWAMGGAGDLNDIVFDSHRKRLVGGCTKLRAWVLKSVKSSARSTTHESGVVRALFNRGFNQVVSGDTRGMVRVWDVNTGRSVSKFQVESENASDDSRPKPGAGSTTNNAAKGAGTTLTAMAFDQGGRRLITGTHDVRSPCVTQLQWPNQSLTRCFAVARVCTLAPGQGAASVEL